MKYCNAVSSVVAVLAMTTAAHAATVFWTDPAGPSGSHVIRRSGPDIGIQTIVTGQHDPLGMALDAKNGKIYWGTGGSQSGVLYIRRANLDGTAVETVVTTPDPTTTRIAYGLAVDNSAGKLYWTEVHGNVRRANLDGSNVEDVIVSGLTNPAAIAIDSLHGKLYWSDLEGNLDDAGRIMRSNLDGSNIETIHTGIDEASGLAVDPVAGKIYWPELRTKRIQRSNLDGTGIEDVAVNLLSPTTLGLDFTEGKIYWTDSFGGPAPNPLNRIERANFDGSARELIVSGIGLPWGIAVAVIPEPPTVVLGILGTLSLIAFRQRSKPIGYNR